MNFVDITSLRDRFVDLIYLEEELQQPSILDSVKNAIEAGIHQTTINTWNWMISGINNSIDGLALISVMVTWMLYMMSVPWAGRWCYSIFAVYIVTKILIKTYSMI
jgi:hypothetical protein